MEKNEVTVLRELIEKLTTRVTTLENELGALRAELENSSESDIPKQLPPKPAKRSPPRKPAAAKTPVKKSNFEDDGSLYFVADYTDKSYAVFGKTAFTLIEPATKGFRMIRSDRMAYGPGATGPQVGGSAFITAVKGYIAANQLKVTVVETTRAQMEEQFGLGLQAV